MAFQRRVVAFLDVLGFKELVLRAEGGERQAERTLASLMSVLESHVRFDNATLEVPNEVVPSYLLFSDSLVLSVLETFRANSGETYDGVAIVCAKAIQLAHTLLEGGTLLRGGIHVGPVRQEPSNIFGSGFMRASLLEHVAWSPRVLLSGEAAAAWKKTGGKYGHLVIRDGADSIVDLLHPVYSRSVIAGVYEEDVSTQYRAHIVDNLTRLREYGSGWTHWAWIAQFFNRAIARHSQLNVEPIQLPQLWKLALLTHQARHLPEKLFAMREARKMERRRSA